MIHDPYRLGATELPDSLLESRVAFRRVFNWPCNKALRVGLDAGVRDGWEIGHAANPRSLDAVSGSGPELTRSSFNCKLILRVAQVQNGRGNLCAVFMIMAIFFLHKRFKEITGGLRWCKLRHLRAGPDGFRGILVRSSLPALWRPWGTSRGSVCRAIRPVPRRPRKLGTGRSSRGCPSLARELSDPLVLILWVSYRILAAWVLIPP